VAGRARDPSDARQGQGKAIVMTPSADPREIRHWFEPSCED
jgi:hypothetical protein